MIMMRTEIIIMKIIIRMSIQWLYTGAHRLTHTIIKIKLMKRETLKLMMRLTTNTNYKTNA